MSEPLTGEELERFRGGAQAAVDALTAISREAAEGATHAPPTLAEEWEWQVVSEILQSREETYEPLRSYVEEVRPDLVLRLLSDLAAARAEADRLRKAAESVVKASDTAPPMEFIAHISRAVEECRAALAPSDADLMAVLPLATLPDVSTPSPDSASRLRDRLVAAAEREKGEEAKP